MALSTRGKTAIGIITAVVVAGAGFVGYRLLTRDEGEPIFSLAGLGEPDPTCPLTGLEPEDASVLSRRVLAVKIENLPEARPQMGLQEADIVYEEETEGGITRFIALYHCQDARRIGPIRSARPVDPGVLLQYVDPLFVSAGGASAAIRALEKSGLERIDCLLEEETCLRDESREAPHDVFASTDALRDLSDQQDSSPETVFTFSEDVPGAQRGREIHLDFSPYADVNWAYRGRRDEYVRFHGEDPNEMENGEQVSATNLVVMLVDREATRQDDINGDPIPTFKVVGTGKLLVFRSGKVVEGTWERKSEDDVTQFLDKDGEQIALAPGRTWVELFPTDAPEPDF